MSALLLLDTNIISDIMRNPSGRAMHRSGQFLRGQPDARSCTSVVVDCELRFGLAKRPNPRLASAYQHVMATMEVLPMVKEVAASYAVLRKQMETLGLTLGPNDMLIAAHALSLDAILVSADAAFAQVPGLRLENWLLE